MLVTGLVRLEIFNLSMIVVYVADFKGHKDSIIENSH